MPPPTFHSNVKTLNFGFLYFSRASQYFKEEKALLQPVRPSGNNSLLGLQSRQSVRLPVSRKYISLERTKELGVRSLTAVKTRSCSGLGRISIRAGAEEGARKAQCYQLCFGAAAVGCSTRK